MAKYRKTAPCTYESLTLCEAECLAAACRLMESGCDAVRPASLMRACARSKGGVKNALGKLAAAGFIERVKRADGAVLIRPLKRPDGQVFTAGWTASLSPARRTAYQKQLETYKAPRKTAADKARRQCLCCHKAFPSESRFNRLCADCKARGYAL